MRAQSRLHSSILCIIIDGMDQAKFAWPRAPFLSSHEFGTYHRPRLHVWGVLVHGYMTMLTISHADVHKGTSTSVEVLAYVLTQLAGQGIDISKCHLHLQLDNASSTNKNNAFMAFLGMLTGANRVAAATMNFLRKGHTHEEID